MGKTVYLNLAKHYISAKTKNQTPNTPNVNLFWALDVALDNALADGGVEARVARYKECAGILRQGMKDMGLKSVSYTHLLSCFQQHCWQCTSS